MERESAPHEPDTLRFVLDGVYYALQQNVYGPKERTKLEAQLQDWFPGIHFVVREDEIKYFEEGVIDDGA